MLNLAEENDNKIYSSASQEEEELMKELMDIYKLNSEWSLVELYCRVKINEEVIKERRELIKKRQKTKNFNKKVGDRYLFFPRLRKIGQCKDAGSIDSFFEQNYITRQGLTLDGFIGFLRELWHQYQLYEERSSSYLI